MKHTFLSHKHPFYLLFATLLLLLAELTYAQPISLTGIGTSYSQDFNTLANSGNMNTVVPAGWAFVEAGTNGNTFYTGGTGSGSVGDTYSFGVSMTTERAFGELRSGTCIPTLGGAFTNNTGTTIGRLTINYTGEQWRVGVIGRLDQMDFQYSLNATSLTTGAWTDFNALDFIAPNTTGPAGSINGNASGNFTILNATITGLSIANGSTFWIRWTDLDATGADDGLSADDFSIYPCPSISCPADIFVCEGSAPFMLTGASPAGGTFSGTGVTGTTFDPVAAGIGVHQITYTYMSGSCNINCMFNVTVSAPPVVEAGSYGPVCITAPNITLTGTPGGGTWSGVGIVNGNQFDPSYGTQTLTYSVNYGGDCVGTDNVTITVNQCLVPPEMRFVLLPLGKKTNNNNNCISTSNCDANVICFGIQYTPAIGGSLTSYTTGFVMSCLNGVDPELSNGSCSMTNSSFSQDSCASLNLIQWNWQGNSGNFAITANVPDTIHQICFTIPNTGSLSLEPFPETDNLSTSIDAAGGPVSELPTYIPFAIDSVIYCAPLPVTLLQFEAFSIGEFQSKLQWMTTEEINNAYFDIQRSNDGGKTFTTIGRVNAAEHPRSINLYQFVDYAARPGMNYYRLKQFDIDGLYAYSPIRNVMFSTPDYSVKVWPNPVGDQLNIYISRAEVAGDYTLVDMTGRKVIQQEFEEGNSSHEVAVDSLIPGVYTLIVQSGVKRHIEKIVITR